MHALWTAPVVLLCGTTLAAEPAATPAGPAFPAEEMHPADVGADEAVTNLRIANNRWVDCFDDSTAIRDMFRIEGVADKGDQQKALALWKWFRILVSATCGGYCYETDAAGREGIVMDPHKIFTVYGHHQCDGQSWAMVPLWRAAGYVAFDECHLGHTIASLRYQDADGHYRFHDFDPQHRFYYWDQDKHIVGTWTMPLLRGRVHRHLLAPQVVHDLRRSLRTGETIELLWNNEGHVVPAGKQLRAVELPRDYAYSPGKTNGVYAAVGQETQTLVAELSPQRFAQPLYRGSENVAASVPAAGRAVLHPARKGAPGVFIYRLISPYVAVDAVVEATLVKGQAGDTCRLWLSRDGGRAWLPIHACQAAGIEKVKIGLGTAARAAGKPHVYTAYDFFIKAEFASAADEHGVGMNDLKIVVYRQCNKRTLPNLMPGENCFRVTFDRLSEGKALELAVSYSVAGRARQVVNRAAAGPFGFRIDTGEVPEKWLRNYDQAFNVGALRMESLKLRLVDAAAARPDPSDPVASDAKFRQPSPHPADMTAIEVVQQPETDPMQTSGFFPQSRVILRDPKAMDVLAEQLKHGKEMEHWVAAEDLGNYPQAVDILLAELPRANSDLKLHICKALAQIRDKRAIGPLLELWSEVPRGTPGTRYIPDVLAAIGDAGVVPALVAPLHRLRFDYRFHIADALGKLGGPQARAALAELAERDPLPAIRQHAKEMLEAPRLSSIGGAEPDKALLPKAAEIPKQQP